MHETIHIGFSLVLLKFFPNPFIVLPLAFVMHFVLDVIPHYRPRKSIIFETAIEALVAMFVLFLYILLGGYSEALWLVLATVFAGVLPDFFLLFNFGGIKIWESLMIDFHTKIQHEYHWAWIVEVIFLIVIVLCLIYL